MKPLLASRFSSCQAICSGSQGLAPDPSNKASTLRRLL